MIINTKLIDRILGLLITAEMVFLIWLISPVLESLLDIYKGIPLTVIVIRIILHFSLGILVAIQLFRKSPTAKWTFLSYVIVAVIEKFWRINPNTDKYMAIVGEAQRTIAQGSASVTTTNIFFYPSWWTWVLYCVALLYMFIIRQRCNKSLKQDAA